MKSLFYFVLFVPLLHFSQDVKKDKPAKRLTDIVEQPRAKQEQYKIITLERDTTYVDTSLSIKSDYKFNYLKKDLFGLMPFANEGQTYTTLDFSLKKIALYPQFGFKAKHFNFFEVDDIKYYSVATPLTELYFKTVMEQGQSVDAFITLNTTDRLNFSIAYRGIRSLGKFINQLSSHGNFRFTTSYYTKNKKYFANAHFTGQDLLNGENGGITTTNDFEGENTTFRDRARLQVFLTDARSFMRGKRFFLDHRYKLNSKKAQNAIFINHQFNFENKYFEFNQVSLTTALESGVIQRFGTSYVGSNINDQTRYTRLFNKVGVSYYNMQLGEVNFFVENFNSRHVFNKVLILDSGVIPNLLEQNLLAVGGQYNYRKGNWNGTLLLNKAISTQTFSTIEAAVKYRFDDVNSFQAKYSNTSKLPDNNFVLNQSSYIAYNWNTNFDNEKINAIDLIATTKWATVTAQASVINDYLYFSNDDTIGATQLVTPKQFMGTINYLSVKANKEFKYKKWALDTTILYQNVTQDEAILNVPQIVTRNSFYFTDKLFKKAMFFQSGFTVSYFTKYFADGFNPLLNEFFTQQQTQIGATPFVDFFVNARIQQTRVFFKAEHLNSRFSNTNYYAAPNHPYRDFMIRFGLVWNFFQ
jgi:hypothetical protein